MDNLSARLKAAREAKGLSQAQLGKMAHCGQTTIASIENGRNKGSTKLAVLAAILGVEPLWLAEGRGPKEREVQYQASTPRIESTPVVHLMLPEDGLEIAEVVRMMRATDDLGRCLALGAVRGALANHHPTIKNHRVQ